MTDRAVSAGRRPFVLWSAVVVLAAALAVADGLSAPAAGADKPSVPVRFGSHPTYQRMVMDWPAPVGYRVEHVGRMATIVFDTPAAFREALIAAGLGRTVAGVTTDSDGRTSRIALQLAEGIELRHLRVETRVVIDLLHGGRAAAPEPAAAAPAASRPWDNLPLRSAAVAVPVWDEAQKALAPPPPAERSVSLSPVQANPAPLKSAGPRPTPGTVPAAAPASAAPVKLASREPTVAVSAGEAPHSAPPIPVPPWRQDVRAAACRGDLERAAEILGERMAASPLDPIDWYNLTWLLRTLANVTMEPPPGPPDSPIAEAPLAGLCSGRPVAGTVATWQRLAHAGQFTEFLIDIAGPAAARR